MSHEAMEWVLKMAPPPQPKSAHILLLCLAYHAQSEGDRSFPSRPVLAEYLFGSLEDDPILAKALQQATTEKERQEAIKAREKSRNDSVSNGLRVLRNGGWIHPQNDEGRQGKSRMYHLDYTFCRPNPGKPTKSIPNVYDSETGFNWDAIRVIGFERGKYRPEEPENDEELVPKTQRVYVSVEGEESEPKGLRMNSKGLCMSRGGSTHRQRGVYAGVEHNYINYNELTINDSAPAQTPKENPNTVATGCWRHRDKFQENCPACRRRQSEAQDTRTYEQKRRDTTIQRYRDKLKATTP
ncbi:hypothetical protein [Corynebacterium auriscanis]|uniref:Uncharacterized protein n=1 Tax=Corynebacterium auriscanis TaxID=99807 RepID=A0A0A2DG32_9CORY|nr:hypothetical protein [Corynebacterium auriscanis]KGM18130.1 hypothetical protein MA47_09500 [Corynebacterium auriscanis]WJY73193.1 hypothetical protein CAURIC_07890 [Corynebacterium auriscanis]